jgi:hypothetical protein
MIFNSALFLFVQILIVFYYTLDNLYKYSDGISQT